MREKDLLVIYSIQFIFYFIFKKKIYKERFLDNGHSFPLLSFLFFSFLLFIFQRWVHQIISQARVQYIKRRTRDCWNQFVSFTVHAKAWLQTTLSTPTIPFSLSTRPPRKSIPPTSNWRAYFFVYAWQTWKVHTWHASAPQKKKRKSSAWTKPHYRFSTRQFLKATSYNRLQTSYD